MAAQQKSVAVIILNWNGEKLLREFLPSVVANTPARLADVIVADNGSTDGSLELLAAEFPGVEVLKFDDNHGFAGGYNLAIAATQYRYTVLLNSDVETPPHWLEPMLEVMENNPDVGACQPKILSYRDKSLFEYAGAAGGYIDRNGFPYCRGRLFSTVERDSGQYDTPSEVFWATGAALMVRSSLYLQLEGLDSRFFAHMEEIDLCWRIQLAGYRIMVVPQSCVYHLGGGSLAAGNPRKTYLNFRNNLLMMHKNIPASDLRSALLRRRLLDTLEWCRNVATLRFAHASAIWRAHRDFREMRKEYASHPQRNLLKGKPNLLVEYFLKGKRRFSRIHT